MATFTAFDIETTGLSPSKNRILEIGAVKFRGGKVIDQNSWLINPGVSIPERVQLIHRITPPMVAASPSFSEVWPEFDSFTDGTVLLAHNARFDMGFLNAELARNGLPVCRRRTIDTLKLFRTWMPAAASHSLKSLCTLMNVKQTRAHRASADAMSLFLLFRKAQPIYAPAASLSDLLETARQELKMTAPDSLTLK